MKKEDITDIFRLSLDEQVLLINLMFFYRLVKHVLVVERDCKIKGLF